MKYRTILILAAILALLAISGCDKRNPVTEEFTPFSDLVVSDNFDYNTLQTVDVNITALTNTGAAVSGTTFQIFDADPDKTGNLISTGAVDPQGNFTTRVSIAKSIQSVFAVGMMQTLEIPVINGKAELTLGGAATRKSTGFRPAPNDSKTMQYLPWLTYSSQGVPSPMTFEALSADYMAHINNTFPERESQPALHPSFFGAGVQRNIRVNSTCEMYITFVHDGAAYQNCLGFYTYDIGTTPTSAADIEPLTMIFPNASIPGGGGGMNPGDRVYLGTIPGGKMLGWFLVADGWDPATMVGPGLNTYYSNSNLNPESTSSHRDHSLAVYDPIYHRIILGFEDKYRDSGGGSDHDFNDVMFSIQVTPESSIDPEDLPVVIPPVDTDGDGVGDDQDEYPTDPTKAFNNYTPSETTWGTLAYEDLWPQSGDYDFNDLVVDYNINQITNGYNKVSYIESKYKLVANGARQLNGFAVEYPVTPANVTNLVSNLPYMTLESGGPKAVVRVFDNAFNLIPAPPNGAFINTVVGEPYQAPVQVNVNFRLVTPVYPSTFAHQAPYNPFLFKTHNRGLEVHLAGYAPTTLVNPAYFGTDEDGSIPATGHYYFSKTNLPFALNIATKWNYPKEKTQLTRGYLKFVEWAQSNGLAYRNWYEDQPGYINDTYIYLRP